jgi:hypothetical protein
MTERFCVDEDGFGFNDESSTALEGTLAAFVDTLDYAEATGYGVVRWSEIWHVESASGCTLSDLLFGRRDLDRDLRLLCGGRLDKLRCWDDDASLNPSLGVLRGETEIAIAPSMALCMMTTARGRGMACLTTNQSGRRGALQLSAPEGDTEATVYFLAEPADGVQFWRDLIELEDLDGGEVASLSGLAFPRVRFGPHTWRHVNRFEGTYRDIRPRLIQHLSALNDHAPEVWADQVEPARISAEMSSRARVNCSPESPQTHKNRDAMAQRTVDFDGDAVVCEWHTKFERHRNRVYFAVVADTVFVGIFTDHLD